MASHDPPTTTQPTITWHRGAAGGEAAGDTGDARSLTILQRFPDRPRGGSLSVAVFAIVGITAWLVLGFGVALGSFHPLQMVTLALFGAGFLGGAWMMRHLVASAAESMVVVEHRDGRVVVTSADGAVARFPSHGAKAEARPRRRAAGQDQSLIMIATRGRREDVVLVVGNNTVTVARGIAPERARDLVADLGTLLRRHAGSPS